MKIVVTALAVLLRRTRLVTAGVSALVTVTGEERDAHEHWRR